MVLRTELTDDLGLAIVHPALRLTAATCKTVPVAKPVKRKVPRRRISNPKRKLAPAPVTAQERAQLRELAMTAKYGGNPDHKRNPGDFGLGPPNNPRWDASLCDDAGITKRSEVERLLRRGIELGLVSVQVRNGWPQNVWAVAENGVALEAMLENQNNGTYHGYPMLLDDALALDVKARWKR